MDIKKLYGDALSRGYEIPIYAFIVYLDCFARKLINCYGKKYTVICGEYITPKNLDGAFALDGAYYTAALSFVIGEHSGNAELIKQSEKDARDAYLSLWKAAAKGKHIIKERW